MTMTDIFFISTWRTNLLYDDNYIIDLLNSFDISDSSPAITLLNWIKNNYHASQFKNQSEAQLENAFIRPLSQAQ